MYGEDRQEVTVKKGSCCSVQCRVHTGTSESVTVMFEADVERQLADGLEISDAVVTIPKGSSCHMCSCL